MTNLLGERFDFRKSNYLFNALNAFPFSLDLPIPSGLSFSDSSISSLDVSFGLANITCSAPSKTREKYLLDMVSKYAFNSNPRFGMYELPVQDIDAAIVQRDKIRAALLNKQMGYEFKLSKEGFLELYLTER